MIAAIFILKQNKQKLETYKKSNTFTKLKVHFIVPLRGTLT